MLRCFIRIVWSCDRKGDTGCGSFASLRASIGCSQRGQLPQQIGPPPLDEGFHLSNATMEIRGLAGPPLTVSRGFDSDLGFVTIEDWKQFLGREFALQ